MWTHRHWKHEWRLLVISAAGWLGTETQQVCYFCTQTDVLWHWVVHDKLRKLKTKYKETNKHQSLVFEWNFFLSRRTWKIQINIKKYKTFFLTAHYFKLLQFNFQQGSPQRISFYGFTQVVWQGSLRWTSFLALLCTLSGLGTGTRDQDLSPLVPI